MLEPMQRRRRQLATLSVALLVLTLLPGLSTQAQPGVIDQALDNAQAEFARGTFSGTAISPEPRAGTTPLIPNDVSGAVQLAPLGLLNQWPIRGNLPQALASHGVASIGNRLYTVAGATSGTGGATSAVYWSAIDQTTGAQAEHGIPQSDPRYVSALWLNDPLPRAVGTIVDGCTDLAANGVESRVNPAVAALDNGNGSGFLYVVGGSADMNCEGALLSTPLVQIGTVAADGEISWTGGAQSPALFLPSPLLANDTPTSIAADRLGIQSAQAVTVRTGSGKVYLYVLGGAGIFPTGLASGGDPIPFTTPAVFYTEINPNDGSLRNPTTGATNDPWARTANIPVQPPPQQSGQYGIYEHTATAARTLVGTGTGTTIRTAIYVAGGYIQPAGAQSQLERSTFNPFTFLATVNENTGALTWNAQPAVPPTDVATEGGPVASLASLAYNQKLYLIAGTSSGSSAQAFDSVITGGHDSSFNFQPLAGSTDFFVGRQQTSPVLAEGLIEAGAALIDALPPAGVVAEVSSAWSYVVGGVNRNDQLSTAIYGGKLGGENEASGAVRTRDGWFYSQLYDISITRPGESNSSARVLAIRWGAELDRGGTGNPNADIIIEFRKVLRADLRCDTGAFADDTPWFRLDGDTASESFFSSPAGTSQFVNEVSLRDAFGSEDFNATCFQYRARLLQNGLDTGGNPAAPANPGVTPRLLSISIQKVLPGFPDLKLQAFEIGPDAQGRLGSFNLQITNLNGDLNNTIAAPVQEFPVVLCVARTNIGEAPPTLIPPTVPIANDPNARVDCAPVYRFVEGPLTAPGVAVTLNSGWQANYDNIIPGFGEDDVLPNICAAFDQPGQYAVAALIDPFDLVFEGGDGKTNNRGENLNSGQPLIRTFTITQSGCKTRIHLPVLIRSR